MQKTIFCGPLVAAAVLCGASAASAQEFRYDNGLPENHILNTGPKHFAAALKAATDGKMTVNHFYGALQTLAEAAGGLRDGVLDIGASAPQYLPGEFPVNSFVSQLPAYGTTSVAMSGADTEFVLLHCAPCLAEFTAQNQLPMMMHSNPTYQLILGGKAKPVVEPGDLAGLRLRSGGDYFRDWIEYMGAVAVTVPGPETYDAFSSGILDGTAGAIIDIPGFKLEELVGSVTMIDIGPWHSASFLDMRLDLWRGLSEKDRAMMLDLAMESQAAMSIGADTENQRVIDDLAARKAIVEPGAALREKHQAFIAAEITKVAEAAERERGIKDAAALAQTYVELTKKWEALSKTIDIRDPAQVKKLYETEIYAKIDRAAHAM